MEKSLQTFVSSFFLILLRGYKLAISPFLSGGCRFQPTCSEYAGQAIKSNGIFKGSFQAVWRICRCHPWGDSGYDPVPSGDNKVNNNSCANCGSTVKNKH